MMDSIFRRREDEDTSRKGRPAAARAVADPEIPGAALRTGAAIQPGYLGFARVGRGGARGALDLGRVQPTAAHQSRRWISTA